MSERSSYHLEKLGLGGALVTLACCLGFGPIIALFTALGVGVLVNDAVLAPLLIVFLAVGLGGLFLSRRGHGRWEPVGLHVASAACVYLFTFVRYRQSVIWAGVAGLLAASVWDLFLRRSFRRARKCERSNSNEGEGQ